MAPRLRRPPPGAPAMGCAADAARTGASSAARMRRWSSADSRKRCSRKRTLMPTPEYAAPLTTRPRMPATARIPSPCERRSSEPMSLTWQLCMGSPARHGWGLEAFPRFPGGTFHKVIRFPWCFLPGSSTQGLAPQPEADLLESAGCPQTRPASARSAPGLCRPQYRPHQHPPAPSDDPPTFLQGQFQSWRGAS